MNLPESLTDSISKSVTSTIVEAAGDSAALTLKDIASKIFAAQMTLIIVNAVSYCIVFIALYIVLKLLTSVTGIISRLPVIHQADRFLECLRVLWKDLSLYGLYSL